MSADRRLMALKRACYLGVAFIGAVAMITSRTFDPANQFGTYGPAFVPFILGAALVILGVLGLIRPGPVPRVDDAYNVAQLLIAIGVMAAYVALFRPLGFLLDTLVAGAALSLLLVRDHRRLSLLGVVAFVVLTYVLLHNVLEVQFPSPPWLTIGSI